MLNADAFWPWLAMAGVGALHGLHPASGWPLVAAWGMGPQQNGRWLPALVLLALGHVAAVALVVAATVWGVAPGRRVVVAVAGVLCVAGVLLHLRGRAHRAPVPMVAGPLGVVAGAFGMATVHGAGLMLVPALVPLCAQTGTGGSADAPWLPALTAMAVHAVAMLLVAGCMGRAVQAGALALWHRMGPARAV